MLEHTFVHVPGIGYKTERRLWAWGADCWQSFLARPAHFGVPPGRLAGMLDTIHRSRRALDRGELSFFSGCLPSREHWRALPCAAGRVAYLDIETDGGIDEVDAVTVIGLHDGSGLRQFVRGENLLEFEDALDDTALLVTYNGSGFDLPVLRRAFPRLRLDQLHLDLCPTLRRLGLVGGLKRVEEATGITRGSGVAGLNGWDAVRLWREYRWGSDEALRLLLAYNAADVVNMIPLAELAYSRLAAQLRG